MNGFPFNDYLLALYDIVVFAVGFGSIEIAKRRGAR